jgi:hypothetical protein
MDHIGIDVHKRESQIYVHRRGGEERRTPRQQTAPPRSIRTPEREVPSCCE